MGLNDDVDTRVIGGAGSDPLSSFTTTEVNGVLVASRPRIDFREGPGLRFVSTDERESGRVTVRGSQRAIGGKYHMWQNQSVVRAAWTGVNTGGSKVNGWNYGGVEGTAGASSFNGADGMKVLVTGVWALTANITANTGLVDSYMGIACNDTTFYGAGQPNMAQAGPYTAIGDSNLRQQVTTIARLTAGTEWGVYMYHTLGGNATVTGNVANSFMVCEFLGEVPLEIEPAAKNYRHLQP